MPTKHPQLAKLTRPRLHKAVARERLFALLDDGHEHKSAICVVGPPGAGKTTLVASWLDASGLKGIWYQVDPGDGDLATFFYYLGEAAKPFTRKGQRPLPLLTPEYLQDVEGFSRRFFRELFLRLPEDAAVVLDNYQEVAPDQPFHQLIAQAVDEVSAGAALIVVSRRDPPDCYARLIANENVQLVEWDALKLTIEEARAITVARGGLSDKDLRQLHERSGGWAAGFTLMLEGSRREESSAPGVAASRDALFAYFAEQIFGHVSRATQEFLVATAYLPQIPVSVARELTGNEETETILDDLYRRHLFTHRRSGSEPIYWYHALFRDFLKTRAATVLGTDAASAALLRAARLLDARAAFDEAFQLFNEGGDWTSSARLVRERAPYLLAQGRGQTLRDWVLALPASLFEQNPWLRYWLGVSLIPINQREARRHLEYAFGQFGRGVEVMGQALAASGVIESYYYEWSDFREMRKWVDALEPLLDQLDFANEPVRERQVYVSLVLGMLYGAPGHRLLPKAVERVSEMLDEEMDVNSKVSTAMVLLSYANIACDMSLGHKAVQRATPLLGREDLTPFNQLWWRLRLGHYLYLIGDYQAGVEALDTATQIADTHGFQHLRTTICLIASFQTNLLMALGDVRGARQWHERITATADPARKMDTWHVAQSTAHLEFATGNFAAMAEVAQKAAEAARATGMAYLEVLSFAHRAESLAILGKYEELHSNLEQLSRLIFGTCFAHFECEVKFLEAYSWLRRSDDQRGRNLVIEALKLTRTRDWPFPQYFRFCGVPAYLLAVAIESGIETDLATDIIRRRRIAPPPDSPESWPWPVKVYSLGRYEVYQHGEHLQFAGKVPKRPLTLLKTLIAFGGRNVPEERLMDALWPDEEADAARKSLDITVLRLRKLLGSHETIIVSDELIGLNPQLCWIDLWAFERRLEQFEAREGQVGAASEALRLYRGNFLPADAEEPWTVKPRERLRAKFVRLVETVALAEESGQRWDQAMIHYIRGLEADDLVEAFYLGLMRCYRALGRPAEAMTTFRRLRQTLSVVLGIAPSPAAETLARELREDSAPHHS
jgi:DNA-binding SARP family transcriptional activator